MKKYVPEFFCQNLPTHPVPATDGISWPWTGFGAHCDPPGALVASCGPPSGPPTVHMVGFASVASATSAMP